jgi:hypothetical protein
MYLITNQEVAQSLVKQAYEMSINVRTVLIEDVAVANVFLDSEGKERMIYENIPIEELKDPKYDNCIIIYTKTNLNNELNLIILIMNMIPKIRNHGTSEVELTLKQRNITLQIDPNYMNHTLTWKDVKQLCGVYGIPFTSQ